MTQHPHMDPAAFFLEGGSTGILLIHGFTGSPPEMLLVGDYLNERDLTVSAPLLPGHGTSAEDLNTRAWEDWTSHVESALGDLQKRCETVFVAGLSLGALLTLYLATQHDELAGAISYSAPMGIADRRIYLLPVIKRLTPNIPKSEDFMTDPEAKLRNWSYETVPTSAAHEVLKFMGEVKHLLPRINCPLLIINSSKDPEIRLDSGQYVYVHTSSADKKLIVLHNCGHVITIDSEWEQVAGETYKFINNRV
ncbi:alpha/beta hydrolase [Chloroflexota bacterium]